MPVEKVRASPAGLQATVIGSLPNEMFRLRLDDGREVTAHAAKNLRMSYVRLVAGDVVRIDLSPFDPNRARIRELLKQRLPIHWRIVHNQIPESLNLDMHYSQAGVLAVS